MQLTPLIASTNRVVARYAATDDPTHLADGNRMEIDCAISRINLGSIIAGVVISS